MRIKIRHAISHLNAARVYSHNSFAQRLKVGALLVRGDLPLALGWNGRLPGEPNVCEDKLEDGSLVTRADVRHAEINTLNKLHRSKESADGAVMFCTTAACVQCAADMAMAGVVGFVFEDSYRDDDGLKYLLRKGVRVYQYDRTWNRFVRHELKAPDFHDDDGPTKYNKIMLGDFVKELVF